MPRNIKKTKEERWQEEGDEKRQRGTRRGKSVMWTRARLPGDTKEGGVRVLGARARSARGWGRQRPKPQKREVIKTAFGQIIKRKALCSSVHSEEFWL